MHVYVFLLCVCVFSDNHTGGGSSHSSIKPVLICERTDYAQDSCYTGVWSASGWYFTFKDNLHKVLCRHFALPGEALVSSAITFRHSLHDEVLPVEASEANIVARIDDLSVSIP